MGCLLIIKNRLAAWAQKPGMMMVTVLLGVLLLEGGCAVAAMAATAQERAYPRYPAQARQAAERSSQPNSPQTDPEPYILPQPSLPSSPSPSTTKPAETRGKYSNPYDRRIPLQGDTHKGYAPARRDPFKR